MTISNKPLSNLQIELLQLYSRGVTDTELIEIKRLIAKYFADRAADEMDRLWEENNWTEDTMENWAEGKKLKQNKRTDASRS